MKLDGVFFGIIKHKDGTTESWRKHNLITKAGYEFVIKSMFETNNRPAPLAYIALGSGLTPTTDDMTALENEVIRVPAIWEWHPEEKSCHVSAQLPEGSSFEVSEAGLFNAATGGVMFDRATFKTKGVDDTDEITALFKINLI